MASNSPTENQRYACKCLNVQITSSTQAPVSSSPEGTRDSAYKPTFVDDDGIVITHPQVTVRTTTHAKPIPGTSRCSRFIVLTCLLCRLPVYRVFQTIPLEIQDKESILLPTDNWVEREILKSATGWVEIHKNSIVEDSISQAKASPSYSRSFSLLLPSSPPFPSPNTNAETSPSGSTELPTQTFLPALRSLFSPPPFTPSHRVFFYLASIANQESQDSRATAEQRIADFIKAEIAVIEAREQKLKHQVEVLWTVYRDHLNTLQEGPSPNAALPPVSMNNSPSVSVRNFNPVPISTPLSPSSSVPRTSALSASMATATFFYHLNANEARSRSSGSYGSGSSHTLSKQSKSPVGVSGTNVSQFARNVDDTINTQASYRYFVNIEEEMARHKHNREVAMVEQEAKAGKGTQHALSRADPSGANINGNLDHKTVQETPQTPTPKEDGNAKHQETPSPKGRDKGKRKATFDVKPAVMKMEEDVTVEQDSGEMVFALEDLKDEEYTGDSIPPLLEQAEPVSRPLRRRKIRPQTNIETFSSLLPSSLPKLSHIWPIMMRGHPHVNSSWTPNSRAWQTFIRRQDSKKVIKCSGIPEEGEEAVMSFVETLESLPTAIDDNISVSRPMGSVPINIVVRGQRPKLLGLSSYTALPT